MGDNTFKSTYTMFVTSPTSPGLVTQGQWFTQTVDLSKETKIRSQRYSSQSSLDALSNLPGTVTESINAPRRISVTGTEEMSHSSGRKRESRPSFIIKPRRCFADEGAVGKFKASFDGEPRPAVEWQKQGEKIQSGGRYKIHAQNDFHFLEIENIDKSDKGTYACILTNSLGTAKATAELEVYALRKTLEPTSLSSKLDSSKKDTSTKGYTANVLSKSTLETAPYKATSNKNVNSVAAKIFQGTSAAKRDHKDENIGENNNTYKVGSSDSKLGLRTKGITERYNLDKSADNNKSSLKSTYTSRSLSKDSSTNDSPWDTKLKSVHDREKTPSTAKYKQVKSKISSWRDSSTESNLSSPLKEDSSTTTVTTTITTKPASPEVESSPTVKSSSKSSFSTDYDSAETVINNTVPESEDSIKKTNMVNTPKHFEITSSRMDKSGKDDVITGIKSKFDMNGSEKKQDNVVLGLKSSKLDTKTSSKTESLKSKFEKGEMDKHSSGVKPRTKYQPTRDVPGGSRFSSMKNRFEGSSGSSGSDTTKPVRDLGAVKVSSTITDVKYKFDDKPTRKTSVENKAFTVGKISEHRGKFEEKSDDVVLGDLGTTYEPRKAKPSKLRSLSKKFAEFQENDNDEMMASAKKTTAKKQAVTNNEDMTSEVDRLSDKQSDEVETEKTESSEPKVVPTADEDVMATSQTTETLTESVSSQPEEPTKPKAISESDVSPVSKTSAEKSSVHSRYQPKVNSTSVEPIRKRGQTQESKMSTTPIPRRGGQAGASNSSPFGQTENLTGRRGARNPPEVGMPLEDLETTDGQYVKLKCSFTGSPSPTISWYFNGAILKDTTEIKQSFDGQWATLKFKDVFCDDTGRYEAVACNRGGEARTACILTVREAKPPKLAPAFTRPLQDKEVSDGDALDFMCEYTGNPEPELTWYHEGKVLESSKDFVMTFENGIAILKIVEVFPEDSGLYELVAKNEKGETKTVANLSVREVEENQVSQKSEAQEEKPTFIRGLKDTTCYDGQKVTLQVEVAGSLPIEVCWVHGKEEIGANHAAYQVISDNYIHKLIIPDVLTEDEGAWMCEAYNNYGDVDTSCVLTVRELSEKSNDLTSSEQHTKDEMEAEAISRDKNILAERKGAIRNENLFQAPKFIMKPKSVDTDEGNGIKFACEVVGNPEPVVSWAKDGAEINIGGRFKGWNDGWKHYFEISHALVTDSGKYDCIVMNNQGQVNCTVTLDVNPLDSPSSSVSDFRSLLRSRPKAGGQIGKPGIVGKTSSLANSSESEAEQLDFRGVLTRHVKTKSRPKIVQELQDVLVKEGEAVSLECKVKGIPTPSISWLVGQKEIKGSRYFQMSYENDLAVLHIEGVYPEDQGEYTCMAENEAGVVESTCDIRVSESQSEASPRTDIKTYPNHHSQKNGHHTDSDSPYTSDQSSRAKFMEEINANDPPFIEDLQPENIGVFVGESFQLKAKFVGSDPLEVTWLHGKHIIQSDDHITIITEDGYTSVLVKNCLCSDTGIYTLSLNNPFGTDSVSASVTVQEVPEAPVGHPSVSNITSKSLILAWSGPSYDGGTQITHYMVEISKVNSGVWEKLTDSCENTSFNVTRLESNMEYICRVSAGNKHGLGPPGKPSDPVVTIDRNMPPSDELTFEPRIVEIDQTRKFSQLYDVGEEIGRGRFGNVYECTEKSSGKHLAAKMIRIKSGQREEVMREIDIMNSLHHPKLLLMYDAFQDPRQMILVMEHVAGGELFERIIDEDYILTEVECVHFMRQICEAIRFMHDHSILHLDLKPENILCITPNSCEIKIIDFGLARRFDPDVPSKVLFGTPEFVAPEVINYDQIGFETDMWSLGVICYILISGLSPFLGDNEAETLANVTMATWDFEDEAFDNVSEEAKTFVQLMLVKNMSKRINVERALRHPWLSQDVKYMKAKRLSTDKHKRFLARRKWQKTGHAIRALGRMANLQKALSTGSSSTTRQNSTGSISMTLSSGSSPRSRNGSLVSETSTLSSGSQRHSPNLEKLSSHKENRLEEEEINVRPVYQNGDISSANSEDGGSSLTGGRGSGSYKSSQDINSNNLMSKSSIESVASSKNNTLQDMTSQDVMSQGSVAQQEEEDEEGGEGAPVFTTEMRDFEVYEGDSARFDVIIDISTNEDFQVIWLKDGAEIAQNLRKYKMEKNKGKCSLIIKLCDLNDDAQYTCKASNNCGTRSCCAELFVENLFGTTTSDTSQA